MSRSVIAGLAGLLVLALNKALTWCGLPHMPPSVVTAVVIAIGGLATYLAELAPAKPGRHWHALVSLLALAGAIGAQYAPLPATDGNSPAAPAAVTAPATAPAPISVEVLAPPDSPPGAETSAVTEALDQLEVNP